MTRNNSKIYKSTSEMKTIIFEYQKTKDDKLWDDIQTRYGGLVIKLTRSYFGYPYYDDLVNTGWMALYEAVINYDRPELNPFTFIYAYVFGRITKEKYGQTGYTHYSKTAPKFISADSQVYVEGLNRPMNIIDTVRTHSQDHSGMALERLRSHLKPSERLMVEDLLAGAKPREMAVKHNISGANLSQRKLQLRKKCLEIIG